MQRFGARLQSLRSGRPMTQQELGDQVGVSRSAVASWETGFRYPEVGHLGAMADLFGVSVDYLLARPRDASRTEERQLCEAALVTWGEESQLDMAIEECAELIAAIQQQRRGRVARQEVAAEVADVEIMCQQLRVVLGDDAVDNAKHLKFERLRSYLRGGQEPGEGRGQ